MIHGPGGRVLPLHLASPRQALPEAVAVLGPGYPDEDGAPCYACGATREEPCIPGCEALRLAFR